MKKIFAFIILLLFITLPIELLAQQYIYQQYTTADGLPSSEVYHVFQDSKGYIWFATDNGVSRYNGYEFENFDVNDGLPVNSTSEIYEDYLGRVWFIGMNSSLSYYENDSIKIFKYNQKLQEQLGKSSIPLKSAFYIDKLGIIYLSVEGYGLYSIDNNGDIKKHDEFHNDTHIISLHYLSNSKIMPAILRSYYKSYDKVKIFKEKQYSNFIFTDSILVFTNHIFVQKQQDNSFIVAANNYIYKIEHDFLKSIKNFGDYIIYLYQDKSYNLWVCLRNGGVVCLKNSDFDCPSETKFLSDLSVSSVIADNNGGTWFSTLGNGVFYFSSLKIKQFTTKDGLKSDNINCIESSGNNLWIGYNSSIVSKKTKTIIENYETKNNSLKTVKSIKVDPKKNLAYIGTPGYIYKISKNGDITSIKNNNKQLNTEFEQTLYFNVYDMLVDGDFLWVSGGNGFFKIKNDNTILDSRIDKNFQIRVDALYKKDSTLWLGTEKGLWSFENNNLKSFSEKHPLLGKRILDIEQVNGSLVLATKGSGIILFDGEKIQQINKTSGLNSNTINTLYADDSIIWSGSVNGLNKTLISTTKNKTVIGLTNQIAELKNYEVRQILKEDKKISLATNKGLIEFYTDDNEYFDKQKIPFYLTNIRINNKNTTIQNHYSLSNSENNLSFHFEGLNYKNHGAIQYRYRLNDLDTTWIYTSNREGRYYRIPPGKYTFVAMVKNQSGEWNKNSISVNIEIVPAIWQTYQFKIVVIFFIMSIFTMVYKASIASIRNKIALKKNMHQYMMQALSAQMNPHFIFNTLNSINNFILSNNKREASKYLTKFSKLIRKILENSRNEYISLSEEISAIELYLEIESLRLKNKFDYDIEWTDDINIFDIKLPSLIIQPFIENSIWHGIQPSDKHGLIKIKISKIPGYLIFEIIDNGIGRNNAQKPLNNEQKSRKSLGSKITNSRLSVLSNLLNKEAKIEYVDLYSDKECFGTKVTIKLPIIT